MKIRYYGIFLTVAFIFSFISIIWYFLKTSDTAYVDRYSFSDYWFKVSCLYEFSKLKLENLPIYVNSFSKSENEICNNIAKLFNNIFTLEEIIGEVKLPNEFEKKVKGWLGNNEHLFSQVKNQKIIKLYNKFMNEELVYNPIRDKRPQPRDTIYDKNYTRTLMKESMQTCDFCGTNYLKNTAYDTFGRMETKYSYTAANTFKYDKWHSLIVSRNHDTLNLNEIETIDMFDLALKWFDKVNKIDNNAKYPEILWDAMPKSGASQIHTHLQASFGKNLYYGAVERLLSAVELYDHEYGRDYISDFILIHQALDLAKLFNTTYVILNLIPVKDFEVMLIDTSDFNNKNIYRVLHHVIRANIDSLNKYSFSMATYLPEYSKKKKHSRLKYKICRIVFRTSITNLRSDINGLDLYAGIVLGVDRYTYAENLFKILTKSLN